MTTFRDFTVIVRIDGGLRCACVVLGPGQCPVHFGCTCRVVDLGTGGAGWPPRGRGGREGGGTAPLLTWDPHCPHHVGMP